jgi:hypothetical protein
VQLIVRPEAEADIGDAYAWYEAQQAGLGDRFLAEMSRCIATSNVSRFGSSEFELRHDVRCCVISHMQFSLSRRRTTLR